MLYKILSENKNLDSKDYLNDHCKQIYNNIMDYIDYVPNNFLNSFLMIGYNILRFMTPPPKIITSTEFINKMLRHKFAI